VLASLVVQHTEQVQGVSIAGVVFQKALVTASRRSMLMGLV
jgi:hypothetical protein